MDQDKLSCCSYFIIVSWISCCSGRFTLKFATSKILTAAISWVPTFFRALPHRPDASTDASGRAWRVLDPRAVPLGFEPPALDPVYYGRARPKRSFGHAVRSLLRPTGQWPLMLAPGACLHRAGARRLSPTSSSSFYMAVTNHCIIFGSCASPFCESLVLTGQGRT